MSKMILKAALLACAATAGNAQALAVAGQGTWETTLLGRDINGAAVTARDGSGVLDSSAVFLYDTVLDVTWLRDANVNDPITWDAAKSWASGLNSSATGGGFTGWRLPTMPDVGTDACNYAASGTNCGYNVQTKREGTVFSEMASLFYDTLGNLAELSVIEQFQSGYGLTNTGDFQNMQSGAYWSGLQYGPFTYDAWIFDMNYGRQGTDGKANSLYSLALRDGDVLLSAVPEPETYALMLAGLALVGAAARRRKAK